MVRFTPALVEDLYDLKIDPYELNNLAAGSQAGEVAPGRRFVPMTRIFQSAANRAPARLG